MSGTYTEQESLEQSKKYFNGNELAANVYLSKYALRNEKGEILEPTPDFMHKRLAKEFARVEKKKYEGTNIKPYSEEEIYGKFKGFKQIIPQGSPMYAIGNPYQKSSASNCFVADSPEDSYGGILHTDQQLVQLSKRRAGVGIDISKLRPKGMPTKNAARSTTGIVPFCERYSNSIREVGQNGRRGALMITCDIRHPESVKLYTEKNKGEKVIIEGKVVNGMKERDIETTSEYYNPSDYDFCTMKLDSTKVTGANVSIKLTDEFLECVKENKPFVKRWPIECPPEEAQYTEEIDARRAWEKIIHCAWQKAEPGILFWDSMLKESPADCYSEDGFKSVSTNPCFSGDTQMAVADGRHSVSIRELAEEGRDVPVYSIDPKSGEVSIKNGRNPRKTRENVDMVRVTLDNGSHLDVTPDHKFPLKSGKEKEAKDLVGGDSLFNFRKRATKLSNTSDKEYYKVSENDSEMCEHRLVSEYYEKEKWDSLYTLNKKNGWCKGGLVVHHKDYNGLNNSPENLEIMTFKDHQKFHADHDNAGENNGKWSGYSNEEIEKIAIDFTKTLNRRFSQKEWQKYAEKRGLPKSFSSYRQNNWFKTPLELGVWAANKLKLENVNVDPRLVKTLNSMLEQGYEAKIEKGSVVVKRICEYSGEEFWINHLQRNACYANPQYSLAAKNENEDFTKNRIKQSQIGHAKRAEKNRENQARIYSQLKFDLGRKPMMKEWAAACKKEGVPFRIGRKMKFNYKSYKEVCEAGEVYNHKVVSVESLNQKQDVYNITVDDNHTVGIVTKKYKNKRGTDCYSGIYALQCGEIVLNELDSCRLLVVNLFGCVDNPYEQNAQFNFDKLKENSYFAQRLMDDLVDLELERVDEIIEKISKDPEDENLKIAELQLWKKIRSNCVDGRRTGTGIVAIGDAIAASNIQYGSNKSIDTCNNIYKGLKLSAYRASVDMAREIGPFKFWNSKKELDNSFLNRIKEEDSDLYEDMQKYGRRNISLLTTAPTGSVAILTQLIDGVFGSTGGIEPNYSNVPYTRKKKVNPDDKDARVDSKDQNGDCWQHFDVYPAGIEAWMEVSGESDIEKSPYQGASAEELDWKQRVKFQAAAQKHVDHSISSTVNLPSDVTEEKVSEIYYSAWEMGLKGVTVYRDGCRTGVLVKKEDKQNSVELHTDSAPKRPKELEADIHIATAKGEKYVVAVGLLDGQPYEIFGGKANGFGIKQRCSGKLIKHKKGQYGLEMDAIEIDDFSKHFTPQEQAIFRMASTMMRHGIPIEFVVEQMQKSTDDMFSLPSAVARVLKKYIKDGQKVSGQTCSSCGSQDLVYQEGCLACKSCGWSKCS